ncbi:hypothetical protein NDU88_005414 [Pleurodeles waltl]|uniref:Uncharacterized protein n=1 Tax=Pleurodeles waltl TaxID=8319 RepID=A0AAV7TAM0_PLEWA|nr:hypothetical protein NDU88_005414 [Pleurodeles waltl]
MSGRAEPLEPARRAHCCLSLRGTFLLRPLAFGPRGTPEEQLSGGAGPLEPARKAHCCLLLGGTFLLRPLAFGPRGTPEEQLSGGAGPWNQRVKRIAVS